MRIVACMEKGCKNVLRRNEQSSESKEKKIIWKTNVVSHWDVISNTVVKI